MARVNNYEDRCMRLALEGERLCKKGSWNSGISHFEEAIKSGTSDLQTLSAVYSQLGNAYFYLQDYQRASICHKQDLTLAEKMGDRIGEAKAYGNLGNTLKALGKFDEAVRCCNRHLALAREFKDRVSEGRALYNLGSVYHTKGKKANQSCESLNNEQSQVVTTALEKAAYYYEENLKLVTELEERGAQGRACGNLGNIYYLLGNFEEAVKFHNERLTIAEEFGDKQAARRAYSNLGNSYVFLGKYDEALEIYKKTVTIAQELNDRAVEAQSYFSLGNIYTLLENHKEAVTYHQLHLQLSEELGDKTGEARACWSLGNALSAMNQHSVALEYATRHLQITVELDDHEGMETAQENLIEIRKSLGFDAKMIASRGMRQQLLQQGLATKPRVVSVDKPGQGEEPFKRNSHNRVMFPSVSSKSLDSKMEGKSIDSTDEAYRAKTRTSPSRLMRCTSSLDEGRGSSTSPSPTTATPPACTIICTSNESLCDDDGFFEMLTRSQSRRLDDQRCTLEPTRLTRSVSATITSKSNSPAVANNDDLMNILQKLNDRLEEQQDVEVAVVQANNMPAVSAKDDKVADEDFFDLLMSSQSSRIDDQRSPDPSTIPPPVPNEDFCNLIQHVQSNRIDDQRSPFPL